MNYILRMFLALAGLFAIAQAKESGVRRRTKEDINAPATKRRTKATYNRACLTGDPHITSFDGLSWDCHGVGEHIILKSTKSQRQVQGRLTRMGSRDVSVLHGIVMQDEGRTAPIVQLSIPKESSPLGTEFGDHQCILDFFVNGIEHSLTDGYEDEELKVTFRKNYEVRVQYKKTGFWVKLRMGYYHGCLLQTCYYIPDTDDIIGLLGSPDHDTSNDWMTRDGAALVVPTERFDRVGQAAYEYCTMNWCMTDHTESIFHYSEIGFGYDFGYYNRCELDYGETLASFIENVDETVVVECKEELSCMMDALEGGLEFALEAVRMRKSTLRGICFEEGGSCDLAGSECCNGFTCTDSGIEKICMKSTSPVAKCVEHLMGSCNGLNPCCDGMICEATDTFGTVCKEVPGLCKEEHNPCLNNNDCCDGLKCFASTIDHSVCLVLGDCSELNQQCNDDQPCCEGMFCRDGNCSGNGCNPELTCGANEELRIVYEGGIPVACHCDPVCPDICGECGCFQGTTDCFVCALDEFIVFDGTACSCSIDACEACPAGSVCIPPAKGETATSCIDCSCGFCKSNDEPCCEPNKEVDANNCKSTGQASSCTLKNFVGFTSNGNSCQGEERNDASVEFGCGCVPANDDVCVIIPKGESCFVCRKDDPDCSL